MVNKKRQNIYFEQCGFQQHARTRSLPCSYLIGNESFRETTLECSRGRSSRGRGVGGASGGGGRGVGPQPTRARTFCLARVWPAVIMTAGQRKQVKLDLISIP